MYTIRFLNYRVHCYYYKTTAFRLRYGSETRNPLHIFRWRNVACAFRMKANRNAIFSTTGNTDRGGAIRFQITVKNRLQYEETSGITFFGICNSYFNLHWFQFNHPSLVTSRLLGNWDLQIASRKINREEHFYLIFNHIWIERYLWLIGRRIKKHIIFE